MKVFTSKNLRSTRWVYPFILITSTVGYGVYFFSNKKQNKEIQSTFLFDAALNAVTNNYKFHSLCSSFFEVKNASYKEDLENSKAIQVDFSCIKGTGYIKLEMNKISKQGIDESNKKQIFYSLLSNQEKLKYLYIPSNLNDILIPTEETLNRVINVLKEKDSINNSKQF